MNAADVAYQQVLAAWISSGAAVVQAVGAIGAIIVSIQLARSSARREREADEAAARRMAEADRAAVERAAEADRAAEARIKRAKDDAHNDLIERITSLGVLATEECQSQVEQSARDYAINTGTVMGGFSARRLHELRERLPALKQETADVRLLEAISDLQDVIQVHQVQGQGGPAYVEALKAELTRIYDALHVVDEQRR
jgi:hypothetical protein